uniref:FGENESH: predicted gene_14.253 protein n=1 Tax=Rhodotorula toruloides TaxID=5286 RepID=A0A0K3CQ85_RHOTO
MSEGRWGEGKGLVFTAGNADTFSRVLTTLRLLNSSHLSSPLPAEIFSFPGEEPDAETRKELEALGARLRVVSEARRGEGRRKNYHIKATAIIRSSFREVLYLDSDNIPAASLLPLELWSNSTQGEASRPAGLWEAEMEAGTILIDKSRHLDALLLAEWMMSSERFEYWFKCVHARSLAARLLGDKDIFRFAFLALRKRWGVPGRSPRVLGRGFKGGGMFALCIDIRFDDPRSEDETWSAKLSVASSSPNPSRLPLEALAANVDVSYTAAPDGFELKFWQDEVLEVVHWADVPRLKGFEEAFFEVGGKVNGEGF